MRIEVVKTSEEMSGRAAEMIAGQLQKKPDSVLSLPTGSTPIGCLQALVKMYRQGAVDFSRALSFNMDEYVGLPKEHPQSYYYFLRETLYKNVNIKMENTFCPDVLNGDLQAACEAYTAQIRSAGGFDFILLGIGRDGHVSFNMPNEALQTEVHLENMTAETVEDNARFFASRDQVPRQAISIGMYTILSSKKIVLIADGEKKQDIVADFLNARELTTRLPASFLWLHDDVTVILDKRAATKVRM